MVCERRGDRARLRPERSSRPPRPTPPELERTRGGAAAGLPVLLLLPLDARRAAAARGAARRAQHARLAAAEVPRPRAGQLGDPQGRAARRGATLHYMVERADAGDIVDQQAVPILQDDDAREVFAKVTVAAETVLARSLPGPDRRHRAAPTAAARAGAVLRAAHARGRTHRLAAARRCEIHNLVRAVAPPFPGRVRPGGRRSAGRSTARASAATRGRRRRAAAVRPPAAKCLAVCGDGGLLRLLEVVDGRAARSIWRRCRGRSRGGRCRWAEPWRSSHSRSTSTPTAARARARCAWRTCCERLGVRATFLFSLGPDQHRARDPARVPPRLPRQGEAHLGAASTTGSRPCCTGCCCPDRTSAGAAASRCATSRGAASRSACTPGITCAGRTGSRGRASRGRGAS